MGTKNDPEPTKWERMAATLAGVADRSTGWVAARIKDAAQDFAGRVIYGETITPEPSDKWDAHGHDGEHERSEAGEVTVIVVEGPDKDRQRQDREDPGMDR